MKIAGFDIGGANTDLAIVDFEKKEMKSSIYLVILSICLCGVIMMI
ncbi:hypothetical protein [Methanobrevibacter arboriphilus]|nr:hypothetical protein [Methanobrevibacter arboriphilus]